MDKIDVVVVGSGIAGLSAAVAAKEAGADSVIVCESTGIIGGASRLSEGIVVGANSRVQKNAGITDSADLMYYDYMNCNEWSLDAGIVRRMAEVSGTTVDWLADLGVAFVDTPIKGGYESVPRCVVAEGRGQGIIDGLEKAARKLGVDFALGQRVRSLIVENGEVKGIITDDEEIRSGAVVVACGGFGANNELMKEHMPHINQFGDSVWYLGEPSSQGDALTLGESAGARIVGHGNGLAFITPNFSRGLEGYLPGWLVIVDPSGRRFLPENAHYSVIDRQARLRGGKFFAIFDSTALDPILARETPFYAGGVKGYPGHEERKSPNWNPEILQEMRDAGRIVSADSIEELGRAIGVDGETLKATIAQYNTGAEKGVDRFNKPEEFLRALNRAPYYAAVVEHALIVITGTGIQIDPEAQALDQHGNTIPGLYAAGESAGEVWGAFYPSSGSSLSSSAIFGRIAGINAASFSKTSDV